MPSHSKVVRTPSINGVQTKPTRRFQSSVDCFDFELMRYRLLEKDPEGVLVLINAIYFKGKWQMQFDPKKTVQAPFHTLSGNKPSVPLMTLVIIRKVLFIDTF
jgi:hypothetical protein